MIIAFRCCRPNFRAALLVLVAVAACAQEPGERLQLFVDRAMVESSLNVELRLHRPKRAEIAFHFDRRWEGPLATYVTVLEDGGKFRAYYRGWTKSEHDAAVCYAESRNGVDWSKPELGLFDWEGSKQNNIVWRGIGSHNFVPFVNKRPGAPAAERYLAIGRGVENLRTLYAFASADGVRWRLLQDAPVFTEGAFDSQNVAFWDPNRGRYVCYYRIFRDGVRTIARAESEDFHRWTNTGPLSLDGAERTHLYTNAITQYFRAPHLYFAFPKRYVPKRGLLDGRADGVSDGIFLSSRDGVSFDWTFKEALLPPGRDPGNWGDRSNMIAWGLMQTAPDEMSIYATEHYRLESNRLRRAVFRIDGIGSAHAGEVQGELITKPLRVAGARLVLNFATSAAGSVFVEAQDEQGKPLPGFAIADAKEAYGDSIAQSYEWKGSIASLRGRTIRLRFLLKECDLYSYRFE